MATAGRTTMARTTAQRRAIIDELRGMKTHPTADELYRRVRRRLPRISLGTVYRNLQGMVETGEARELVASGEQRRFDGDLGRHEHVRCAACGRVADLPPISLADATEAAGKATEYEILGRRLEFVGLCPHCKNGKRAARWKARKTPW